MASYQIIVFALNWIVTGTHILVIIHFQANAMIIQYEAKIMICQNFKICSWAMRLEREESVITMLKYTYVYEYICTYIFKTKQIKVSQIKEHIFLDIHVLKGQSRRKINIFFTTIHGNNDVNNFSICLVCHARPMTSSWFSVCCLT